MGKHLVPKSDLASQGNVGNQLIWSHLPKQKIWSDCLALWFDLSVSILPRLPAHMHLLPLRSLYLGRQISASCHPCSLHTVIICCLQLLLSDQLSEDETCECMAWGGAHRETQRHKGSVIISKHCACASRTFHRKAVLHTQMHVCSILPHEYFLTFSKSFLIALKSIKCSSILWEIFANSVPQKPQKCKVSPENREKELNMHIQGCTFASVFFHYLFFPMDNLFIH